MNADADVEDLRCRLIAAGCLVALSPDVDGGLMTTEAGAAMLLDVAPKTLRNLRAELAGPEFIRHDGRVWYRLDVIARCQATGHGCPLSGVAVRR